MSDFIDAYKDMWLRFAQFKGRTSVGGYWRPVATSFAVVFLAIILIGMSILIRSVSLALLFFFMLLIYVPATVVPSVAMTIRRLHDADKTGWWTLLALVPLGPVVIIVFMTFGGTPGPNRYGPQPLGTQWTTDGPGPRDAYIGEVPATGGPPPASY